MQDFLSFGPQPNASTKFKFWLYQGAFAHLQKKINIGQRDSIISSNTQQIFEKCLKISAISILINLQQIQPMDFASYKHRETTKTCSFECEKVDKWKLQK